VAGPAIAGSAVLARAVKPVASRGGFAKGVDMAGSNVRKAVFQALISIAIAAVLVGAATLARAALTPQLGALSPFMLYVAAVLVAGLVRGPFCGALVLLAGGLIGFRLFLSPGGVTQHGSIIALMIFWGVSAPVLVTANELRVQLGRAMARLSAALDRNGRVAG
jgi:K+-sensing histidine kinase KdpD